MTAIISLVVLSLAWAYAAFAQGAVEILDWRISSAGIALAGLIYWVFNRPDGTRNRAYPSLLYTLLGIFLALATLQITPLSMGLIRIISPQRAVDLQSLVALTGPLPAYATLSSMPSASVEKVLALFAYVLVYFLVRQLAGRFKEALWIPALPLVILGSAEGALGVFQALDGMEVPSGTFVNRNHFAGLLEMCLPVALMIGMGFLRERQDRHSSPLRPALLGCLFFGASAIMLLSIVRSSSRMGFMATMVSLFVMALTWLFSATRESGKLRLIPATILLLVFGAIFIFLPTNQLAERFADMATSEKTVDADSRLQFWKQTMPLIGAYPIAGCGLGAYESCFYAYKAVMPESIVDYAHNDYIQILAEFGIPAFVLIIAILLLVYTRAFHNFAVGKPDSAIALGCVGALTAIMLHSTADYNLYIPANGLIVAWVAGLVRDA